MTLGIDVSRLFAEMVTSVETRDLVVKKMVYHYLAHYAHEQPEMGLMCINTLQRDCSNDDPMVRGLALRSLCSLRLPSILEFWAAPGVPRRAPGASRVLVPLKTDGGNQVRDGAPERLAARPALARGRVVSVSAACRPIRLVLGPAECPRCPLDAREGGVVKALRIDARGTGTCGRPA